MSAVRRFEERWSRAAAESGAVVLTSPDELQRFSRNHRGTRAFVVESVVPVNNVPRQPQSGRVGWLGKHSYEPNADGLLRFIEQGLPTLAGVEHRLSVPGGNVRPDVRAAATAMRVEFEDGFIDDLGRWLSHLEVAVVPIWSGAGVKLKTLTFMAAGVPVVATPSAVEGIPVTSGEHCIVRESPVEMGEELRKLLGSPLRARRIGLAGQALVREHFSQAVFDRGYEHVLKVVAGEEVVGRGGRYDVQ